MEEHQEENSFEKLAFALFGSYKKSLVSLFAIALVLAIPITINLVQQQQDLRQEADTNISQVLVSASPNPASTTSTVSIIVNAANSSTMKLYIMKVNDFSYKPPSNSSPLANTFESVQNTTNLKENTFYPVNNFAGGAGKLTNLPAGDYYLAANVTYGTIICAWNGSLFTRNADNTVSPVTTGQTTCSNSLQQLTVASPGGTASTPPNVSITAIQSTPQTQIYTAGSQVKIITTGTAGSIGTYIFRSSDGNPPNPSVNYPTNQSYSAGSLTVNQFYKISAANLSTVPQTITLPNDPGKYYLVANAHSETIANWWIPSSSTNPAPDYVCSWDSRLLVNSGASQSNPTLQVQNGTGTACNIGPQLLQIGTTSGSSTIPGITNSGIQVLQGSGKLTIQGQNASGYRYYIYRIANAPTPTSGLASVGKYDPTSMLDNQFYYIDDAQPITSLTKGFTLPSQSGNYMVVANAYAGSKFDTICDWSGTLIVPSGTKTPNGCTNKSKQTFTIAASDNGTTSPGGGTTSPGGGTTNPGGGTTNPGGGTTNPGSGNNQQNTSTSNNQLAVAVQLPGIGSNTGDNPSPQNPTRDVEVWVYDTNNTVVKDITGKVTFDGTDTYKGTVDLGNDFQSGYYYVKLRLNNTLKKAVPGVVQINASGQSGSQQTGGTTTNNNSDPCTSLPYPKNSSVYTYQCALLKLKNGGLGGVLAANVTQLPTVTLVPGDIDPNQDNNLDIQDYNMFISCYGSKSCNDKQQADFNDDGVVDGKDYNILARGFAIRQGD